MTAKVQTRSGRRIEATTKVIAIGPALEAIPASLAAAMHLPTNPPPEHALQVQLAIPAGMTLRPGEHVDVTLQ
jgi:hypothetical protein